MTTITCPSELALEVFLLAPGRSRLTPHIETCPGCAERLARMREEGEEFRRVVFPQTVEAIEDAFVKRRLDWRRVFAPAAALAAAAVAATVLLIVPSHQQHRGEEYVGAKGPGMTFAVFANGDDPDCAVEEGEAVKADAELWFSVQPSTECFLWVMSVDASGRISQVYPPPGAPPERRTTGKVPGGFRLDGQEGPERVFAVCAPTQEMSWEEVKATADVASGGADQVRAARTSRGEPCRRVPGLGAPGEASMRLGFVRQIEVQPVHHVREGEPGIGIGERKRAARAGRAERARA
jgi:hypothetical protein